jgi:hypothetical protein
MAKNSPKPKQWVNDSARTTAWVPVLVGLITMLPLSGCPAHRPVSISQPPPVEAPNVPAPTISCTATPSVVSEGESATIRCSAASPQPEQISFTYSADGGTIKAQGDHAIFTANHLSSGDFAIYATAVDSQGNTEQAETSVQVWSTPAPSAGAPHPAIEDTGRDFLLSGEREKAGYGLYSYLLWPNMPEPRDRQRYLKIISAFMSIPLVQVEEGATPGVNEEGKAVPEVEAIAPTNLNVAYIPVSALPPAQPTAAWVLDHYDVVRARILLERVPRTRNHPAGPYIISVLRPLQHPLADTDHYLYQDLSSPYISQDLAYKWVQLFQDQTRKQQFWQNLSMTNFVLSIREQVGALAEAIPAAKAGLATWIQWFGPPAP